MASTIASRLPHFMRYCWPYCTSYGGNDFSGVVAFFANHTLFRDRRVGGGLLHPSTTYQMSGHSFRLNAPPETESTVDVSKVMPIYAPSSLPNDGNARSAYDRALHLLKTNPPEKRLDIHLPYSQYLKLQESWSNYKSEANIAEDQSYPRLSYNSLEQIATVVTSQRALHESAAARLRTAIFNSVWEYLSIHKPDETGRIADTGSTTRKSTYGKYSKSAKDPDGSFMYGDEDKGPLLRVAIEVGFSEDYPGLRRDKDMWIKGRNAKVVILVCLRESPQFKDPEIAYEDIDDVNLELARMGQTVAKAGLRNLEQGEYGPMEYRNHKWFGKLEEAFIECWRADRKRRFRTVLIENGHHKVHLPTTIGLKVRDFLSEAAWAAADIPDSDVRLDLDRYLQSLLIPVQATALSRLEDFI
ncbi:hypothetical protein V1508DRAFT_373733, partial [Lipomyces doorenjongii]|uniref:uncharacterized protein n=1 Tax=Lipomyces doorenjongii TaxID=383834 RepID=UPI0034CF6169